MRNSSPGPGTFLALAAGFIVAAVTFAAVAHGQLKETKIPAKNIAECITRCKGNKGVEWVSNYSCSCVNGATFENDIQAATP